MDKMTWTRSAVGGEEQLDSIGALALHRLLFGVVVARAIAHACQQRLHRVSQQRQVGAQAHQKPDAVARIPKRRPQ